MGTDKNTYYIFKDISCEDISHLMNQKRCDRIVATLRSLLTQKVLRRGARHDIICLQIVIKNNICHFIIIVIIAKIRKSEKGSHYINHLQNQKIWWMRLHYFRYNIMRISFNFSLKVDFANAWFIMWMRLQCTQWRYYFQDLYRIKSSWHWPQGTHRKTRLLYRRLK